MAKSQRASSTKRNNAVLRSKVFNPATEARTARLSAKLQELASKPRPNEERKMDVDALPEATKNTTSTDAVNEDDMNVDGKAKSAKKTTGKKSTRPSKIRITKSKKPRNNIIFPDLQARKQRQAESKARRKR